MLTLPIFQWLLRSNTVACRVKYKKEKAIVKKGRPGKVELAAQRILCLMANKVKPALILEIERFAKYSQLVSHFSSNTADKM